MSSSNLLRRTLLILAMAWATAAPASAQEISEPEFVPHINDLQLFDQPDLSSYGRGPQIPSGWFGSAEFLSWTQGAPPRAKIGQNGSLGVISNGAMTANSGNFSLTAAFGTILLGSTVVSSSGTTVVTTTFQTYAFSAISGTVPSTAASGTVINGGITQTSSLDNTFMSNADYTSGGRFEFGRVDEDGRGWIFSGFTMQGPVQTQASSNAAVNFANSPIGFADFNNDGIDDDLDHDGVYGRFGADLGSNSLVGNPPFILQGAEPLNGIPDYRNLPTDYDDAVPLPTKFVYVQLQNRTSTYGVEAMKMWRMAMGPRGGIWDLFVGPRGMRINDQFYFEGIGNAGSAETQFNTFADNYLIGGQLGGRWSNGWGRVQFGVETRLLAAANYQHVTQAGEIGNVGVGVNSTSVVNVQLPSHFASTVNQTVFAPGGELRLNMKLQLFRQVYLQAGYTALFVDNIARGSRMTYYSLPAMGILRDQNESGFLLHGINLGLVINR